MTEFKMEIFVEIDTDDVLVAEQIVRQELEEAENHPECKIIGSSIGDAINTEVFKDE
jgi:hypothetical protein